MTSSPRVVVIGSLNMDLVVRCRRLPHPGQTIQAESSSEVCGGKGANQAVAAARAGGQVAMVGRVGDDAFAERLIDNLSQEGVDCEAVRRTACPSGLAVVAVEDGGQNSILVVPGANGQVSVDDVRRAQPVIQASDIALVQLEVPLEAVLAAIRVARQANVPVILDPAPAPRVWSEELLTADLLCPNETEAAVMTGGCVESVEDAAAAARHLCRSGARRVAVTLGDRGVLIRAGELERKIDSHPIDAVDTTAAGDAFAGALAVRWAEGADLLEAVQFANAAGAIAASRPGAQPGMANRLEIQALRSTVP